MSYVWPRKSPKTNPQSKKNGVMRDKGSLMELGTPNIQKRCATENRVSHEFRGQRTVFKQSIVKPLNYSSLGEQW